MIAFGLRSPTFAFFFLKRRRHVREVGDLCGAESGLFGVWEVYALVRWSCFLFSTLVRSYFVETVWRIPFCFLFKRSSGTIFPSSLVV